MEMANTLGEPCDMDNALERFILHCRSKNLSPRTVSWYNDVIFYLGEFLNWPRINDITSDDIQRYVLHSMRSCSAITTQGRIRAYRVFFGWLYRRELITKNPMGQIENLKLPKRRPKVLADYEIEAILRQANLGTVVGRRDYCIVATFLDTGIRAGELRGLTLDKLNLREGYLIVVGKGDKERRIHFSEKLRRDLSAYLKMREGTSWGQSNFVFPTIHGKQFSNNGLENVTQRLADRAGLNVNARPHRLRHTSGTLWIERGGDPLTLQQRMGHSTLNITRQYVDQRSRVLRQKAQQFSPLEAIEQERIRLPRKKN